jgi:hypothetical protein
MSTDEKRIQSLMEAFLLSRNTLKSSAAETSFHVDEDLLAAFAEGNLNERETLPMINHLVDCGFCRHKTAELIRLDLAFDGADETAHSIASAAEPQKISEVISGLFAKIFGSAEGAVFAHNEKDAGETGSEDDENGNKNE